jgi:predicted AlkP superfamily pyrophosphatase or phosphodiesterase
MRPDYFERHASDMPTLTALRKKGAWFTNARINYAPTNTAAGHSTIATGADPRTHGITGNNLFDRVHRKRHDMMEGWNPRDLTALTLADVWQLQTAGKARVIGQGSSVPSSTALAGHGACQVSGSKVVHAGYDENAGVWKTNAECFVLPPEVGALDARTLWPADGLWMGHKIDTPSGVRRSGLFPRFEADAFIRAIESQPIGEDAVTDLLLLNYKGADYVGHKHGPESRELAATLAEMDLHFARILKGLEAKVGSDYLIVVTADHGMPSEPRHKDGRHFAPDIIEDLHARFDPTAKSLITYYEPENSQIFVDMDRLAALKLTLRELAAFLQSKPFVYAVFTEDEVRRAAK